MPIPQATERHFTAAEVGRMWNFHAKTIRRMFEQEPGVLCLAERKRGTRIYTTIRIPQSVVERVYKRLVK